MSDYDEIAESILPTSQWPSGDVWVNRRKAIVTALRNANESGRSDAQDELTEARSIMRSVVAHANCPTDGGCVDDPEAACYVCRAASVIDRLDGGTSSV